MKVPQNDQIQSDKTLSALDAYINRVYRIIVSRSGRSPLIIRKS